MKTKLFFLWLLIGMMMPQLSKAETQSGTCGENLTWTLEDGVLVISGTGAMTDYENRTNVPWYDYSLTISTVIIREGVTSIGDYAFLKCYGLTSVSIPNSVTSIGDDAFSYCDGLTSVSIPNSVTSIGSDCFYRCSALLTITIHNSVASIGGGAFWGCPLKYVNVCCENIDDFCKYVQRTDISAFPVAQHKLVYIAGELQTNIIIPNSVTSIGEYAFYCCSGLTSITIPNSVTSIGSRAFSNCSGLTSISIPNSVTSIGDNTFHNCCGLTSVTIPTSVTSIGDSAFGGCYMTFTNFINNSKCIDEKNWGAALCDEETKEGILITDNVAVFCRKWAISIIIPSSVTSIGSRAFEGCSGLTSITIPNSVTSIGASAFKGCKLRSIRFMPQEAPTTKTDAFSPMSYYHTTAYIPIGSWDSYAYNDELYKFINIREEATNVKQIDSQNAFFIMDYKNMSCLKYDRVNEKLVNMSGNGPFDESDLDANWTLIEKDGVYYVYNMGADKYLTQTSTGYALQEKPSALSIANGENAIRLGTNNTEWSLVRNSQLQAKDESIVNSIEGNLYQRIDHTATYNLQGQKETTAKRGLNIVNGNKVLVR